MDDSAIYHPTILTEVTLVFLRIVCEQDHLCKNSLADKPDRRPAIQLLLLYFRLTPVSLSPYNCATYIPSFQADK